MSVEIDLVDVIRCIYCGAQVGQRCTTHDGKPTRSHACRVMEMELPAEEGTQ